MDKKQQQRRMAYDARNTQSNKTELSQIICNKFLAQAEYQQADTVMWYLHCRSEVRTLSHLRAELMGPKKIV
ncbi:MAG: 5-formyltetrahydrofolate cyclo-ligase, partial [Methylococcales bacterium]